MVELRALGQKLKPHWRQFDTRNPPSCVLLANGFKVSTTEILYNSNFRSVFVKVGRRKEEKRN